MHSFRSQYVVQPRQGNHKGVVVEAEEQVRRLYVSGYRSKQCAFSQDQKVEQVMHVEDRQPLSTVAAVSYNRELANSVSLCLLVPFVKVAALLAFHFKMNVCQVGNDIGAVLATRELLTAPGIDAGKLQHVRKFQLTDRALLAAVDRSLLYFLYLSPCHVSTAIGICSASTQGSTSRRICLKAFSSALTFSGSTTISS